jgi:hypothetical protein
MPGPPSDDATELSLEIATAADGEPKNAIASLNWQEACELGFRGDLREWERLLGLVRRGIDCFRYFRRSPHEARIAPADIILTV